MKVISVHRASMSGGSDVPPTEIRICEDIPELPPMHRGQTVEESLAPNDAIYARDAKAIAAALRSSLPGGTFDRLVVELLTIKASHFRGSW